MLRCPRSNCTAPRLPARPLISAGNDNSNYIHERKLGLHCVTTHGTNNEGCPVLNGWIEPTTFRFCAWSLLSQGVDRVSEDATCKARLGHDVVFLGCTKRRMTEKIPAASHINRVMRRPKTRSGLTESMEVNAES
jgi:hypothetical protein